MAKRGAALTPVVHIVAAVIRNEEGRVLLVRKSKTRAFMQPGGKRYPGESDLQTLARELNEELGCVIDPASTSFLGTFRAAAANEPGQLVEAATYELRVEGPIAASSEIEETIWLDALSPPGVCLAPLTRDHILPLVARTTRSASPDR